MKLLVAKNPTPGVDEIRVTMSLTQREATLLNRFLGGVNDAYTRALMGNNDSYNRPVTEEDIREFESFGYVLFEKLDDVVRLGKPAATSSSDERVSKLIELMGLLSTIAKHAEAADEASGD